MGLMYLLFKQPVFKKEFDISVVRSGESQTPKFMLFTSCFAVGITATEALLVLLGHFEHTQEERRFQCTAL